MSIQALRTAAWALIAGALVQAVGGVVGQVVLASTDVSDELFRYPWTSDAFVVTSVVWAVAFGFAVAGLAGLRASGVAGPTRAARNGLTAALVGTALFVVAELASIPVREQQASDGGAGLVGALFGLATVLTGAGLTVAGVAAVRARRWEGWRRFTPLAYGVWMLVMLGVVWTKAGPSGIAVFGILQLALGVALLTRPTPLASAPTGARPAPSIALR